MSAAVKLQAEAPPHSIDAEQMVLGSLLMDPSAWPRIEGLVTPADFYRPDHRLVFEAIEALAGDGKPCEILIVSDYLERVGKLEAAGGLAYLSSLSRDTPTAASIHHYADVVRERAQLRRLQAAASDIGRGIADGASSLQIAAELRPMLDDFAKRTDTQDAPIVLRRLADIVEERREPEWLDGLYKILERSVLAVLAGKRGSFKSFIALYWAMLSALAGHAVAILSGEGAGLDRRVDALMRRYAPAIDLRTLRVVALEHAVNLNVLDTFIRLEAALSAFDLIPDLVVIDTFSKFAPGLDENDNTAVALYLSVLSSQLRQRYGCTVLLVAHAGHGDSKRPRGASVLMANPDAEYIVERPDPVGMTVTVTRERFKDSPSLGPLAYLAEVVDLGRVDRHGDQVTSLVVRDIEAREVPSTNTKATELRGGGQRQLLNALRGPQGDVRHGRHLDHRRHSRDRPKGRAEQKHRPECG